jgi:phenylacetate-CoA ligase
MFNKQLFILAHEAGCSRFYSDYQACVKNQWKPHKELKEDQEKQLRHMLIYCYENVPYYHNLFRSLKLLPADIRLIEDLGKLPVLTKDIIREHWEDFKPRNLSALNYYVEATSGSTGTPFSYRLSKHDRFLLGTLLYRGWGYGGFELGDRMVFLAGSSLDIGTKSRLTTWVHETARNIKKLSSFDMGEPEMRGYVRTINSFRPRFVRGYASSIYFFAKWMEENDLTVHSPAAVFTTAEKLYPQMRTKIAEVFGCEVYDAYGLNDGGISAFECPEHTGLHMDTERSVMEVADPDGLPRDQGEGQILATSLHNYALPFIRYVTGDVGDLMADSCPCGRGFPLIKEILGRNSEMLKTPEGMYIHGAFFNHIFKRTNGIREFQVVQETRENLRIFLVAEPGFDEKQLDDIRNFVAARSPAWKVEFAFVDTIERTVAGKYKYIINKVKDAQ